VWRWRFRDDTAYRLVISALGNHDEAAQQ
jgi:hypothetical protein